MAKAIVEGAAPVNGCPVGGEKVAKNIAEIMGVDSGESVRLTAFVKCNGDCEKATKNYTYSGVKDCRMLALGVLSRTEFRAKWMNEDMKTAKKALKEIREEMLVEESRMIRDETGAGEM